MRSRFPAYLMLKNQLWNLCQRMSMKCQTNYNVYMYTYTDRGIMNLFLPTLCDTSYFSLLLITFKTRHSATDLSNSYLNQGILEQSAGGDIKIRI